MPAAKKSDRDVRRLFFGIEICSPWPKKWPSGRMIPVESRHATLVFLGNSDLEALFNILPFIPLPASQIGLTGIFTQCLFLPQHSPRVVAWEASFVAKESEIAKYQYRLHEWLLLNGNLDKDESRPWLPHVTLCRAPFNKGDWHAAFTVLPFTGCNIHLYESTGSLNYLPIWTHSLKPPFEIEESKEALRISVQGDDNRNLIQNTIVGLSFFEPMLAEGLRKLPPLGDIRDVESYVSQWLKQRLRKDVPVIERLFRSSKLSENSWVFELKKMV